jgi:glycosyltransferase involved in cell wall biosynthesis
MRAVIVSHAAIKAANRRMYRALAQRGCRVTLLVPDRWTSGLGPLRAEPEAGDSPLDVRVRRRIGAAHSNLYWLDGSLDELLSGRDEPRAIYVDEDPAGFAAAQAAHAAKARGAGLVVLGIQNIYKRYPPPFELLQHYVFARSAVAVSVSEGAAGTLRRRGFRGPNHWMPFTTDLVPLAPSERAAVRARYLLGAPLAGYVGRLVPEKGVDLFLAALARLPAVHGVIAGDGPERLALERQARELGLGERVRFTGVLSPLDAERIIGALDVLALPSRTRKNWAEQFGRVLIEAMASEVAVVAADSGAIAEVVGDAGLLVPEDDVPALTAALEMALSPAAATLRSRALGRARAHFTHDVAVDALHDALTLAAHTPSARPTEAL